MKTQDKEYYDRIKKLIKKFSERNDLILLHNIKINKELCVTKLKFHWSESYYVWDVIKKKEMYFFKELDEISFRKNFHEN